MFIIRYSRCFSLLFILLFIEISLVLNTSTNLSRASSKRSQPNRITIDTLAEWKSAYDYVFLKLLQTELNRDRQLQITNGNKRDSSFGIDLGLHRGESGSRIAAYSDALSRSFSQSGPGKKRNLRV